MSTIQLSKLQLTLHSMLSFYMIGNNNYQFMPIATCSDCSYLLLELVSVSFIHAQLGIAQPYTHKKNPCIALSIGKHLSSLGIYILYMGYDLLWTRLLLVECTPWSTFRYFIYLSREWERESIRNLEMWGSPCPTEQRPELSTASKAYLTWISAFGVLESWWGCLSVVVDCSPCPAIMEPWNEYMGCPHCERMC